MKALPLIFFIIISLSIKSFYCMEPTDDITIFNKFSTITQLMDKEDITVSYNQLINYDPNYILQIEKKIESRHLLYRVIFDHAMDTFQKKILLIELLKTTTGKENILVSTMLTFFEGLSLIYTQADIDLVNHLNEALLYGIHTLKLEFVKFLLMIGAAPLYDHNSYYGTPLAAAIAKHKSYHIASNNYQKTLELIHLLLKYIMLNDKIPHKQSILSYTAPDILEIQSIIDTIKPFESVGEIGNYLSKFCSTPSENLIQSIFESVGIKNLKHFILDIISHCKSLKIDICQYLNEALCYGIAQDNLDLTHFLLSLGADPNYKYKLGKTPLRIAIKNNLPQHYKIINELLLYGVDVNLINEKYTPLTYAAKKGNWAVFYLLCESKAKLELKGKDEKNILHILCQNRNEQFISNLFVYFPDIKKLINDKDKFNKMPLHIAVRKNLLNTCRLLIQYGGKDQLCHADKDLGRTPLFYAIEIHSQEIVALLLENNASYDCIETRNGFTPLHLAIHYGLLDICKLILNKITVDKQIHLFSKCLPANLNHATPFEYAKHKKEDRIVNLLEEYLPPVLKDRKPKSSMGFPKNYKIKYI